MNPSSVSENSKRANNFGIIRLLLSIFVIFSHCFPLTGNHSSEPLVKYMYNRTTIGSVSVDCFFLISGYLISMSWIRSKSIGEFVLSRIFRIYPGYLFACIFTIIAGLADSFSTPFLYVKSLIASHDNLLKSLIFFDWGGFNSDISFRLNPVPREVNGSLWTLKSEVQCYSLTLFMGIFGIINKKIVTIAFLFIFYVLYVFGYIRISNYWLMLPRFIMFFLLGTLALSIDKRIFKLTPIRLVASIIVIYLSATSKIFFPLIYPIFITYIIFAFSFTIPAKIENFLIKISNITSKNDFSYGIYLYAFPVQQLIVRFFHIRNPWILFFFATPITILFAYLSCNFIESPAIALKSRLKNAITDAK